jgi:predicted P-loop ATPase
LGTRGKWILELAELDGIAKATPSKVKAFISRAVDHFRLPYDRRAEDFPRECIFCGSVNHGSYLKDDAGARRFWPVTVAAVDLEALQRDRNQLWAEASERYGRGEHWWLDTPELVQAAEVESSATMTTPGKSLLPVGWKCDGHKHSRDSGWRDPQRC